MIDINRTKKCWTCGVEKPIYKFTLNRRAADGFTNICSECTKAKRAALKAQRTAEQPKRQQAQRINGRVEHDEEGLVYKYPARSCRMCANWPCFAGQEANFADVEFAKYGCVDYHER